MKATMSFTRMMLIVWLLSIGVSPADAQAPGSEEHIASAAVEAIRAELPEDIHITLDARILNRPHEVASATSLPLVATDDVAVCETRLPSSCRLLGTDALVTLGELQMMDERTANVRISVREMTSSERQPVSIAKYRVTVRHTADGWSVSSVELISIT